QISEINNFFGGIAGITGYNKANWDTAFGWGNHAGLYKPVGYVPSWAELSGKPSAMPWDLFDEGLMNNELLYLVGYDNMGAVNTYYDVNHVSNWLGLNVASWNQAYSWGNHAGAGYALV